MDKMEQAVAGLKYDAAGLIPAVIVDAKSRAVLMVARVATSSRACRPASAATPAVAGRRA